jgi:hypothetical protein
MVINIHICLYMHTCYLLFVHANLYIFEVELYHSLESVRTVSDLECRYKLPALYVADKDRVYAPWFVTFSSGVSYCDDREKNNDRKVILSCSYIGYFFLGFHTVTAENVFFLFLHMIKKRKTIKTLGFLIPTIELHPLI